MGRLRRELPPVSLPYRLRITRRAFLGTGIAAPLASGMAWSNTGERSEEDLWFAWNEDRSALLVAPVYAAGGQDAAPALDSTGKPRDFWELRPASFGPNARFSLSRQAPEYGADLHYTLRIWNTQWGHISGRPITLHFLRFEEQQTSTEETKVWRFRVYANVAVWSSADDPWTRFTFPMFADTHGKAPAREADRFVLFRDLVKNQDTALVQTVTAAQVNNTLRLMFNGLIGFPANADWRTVKLSFLADCSWQIDGLGTAAILPSAAGVRLRQLGIRWVQNTGTVADAEANRWNGPTLTAYGDASAVGNITLGSNAPSVLISPEATGSSVELRSVREKIGNSEHLVAQSSLLMPDANLSIVGRPTEAVEGLKHLDLRLTSEITAKVGSREALPRHPAGACRLDGFSRRDWEQRISTPIGDLLFKVPIRESAGPREKGKTPATEGKTETLGDAASKHFETGPASPLQFMMSWKASNTVAAARLDHAEINGLLLEADTALTGADFSRLTFEPTDALILYSPGALASEPLVSTLRLGETFGSPRARLDLSRAKLRARRAHDLVSLTFRFADLMLVYHKDQLELVGLNSACLAEATLPRVQTGRSGTVTPPRPDVRPRLIVEFPPQHLLEEALSIPNDPDLPDVTLDETAARIDIDVATGKLAKYGEPGSVRVDLNEKAQVLALLQRLPADAARFEFRSLIRGRKSQSQAFRNLAAQVRGPLSKLVNLPLSQTVYIGPYALDADAMALVRKKHRDIRRREQEAAIAQMIAEVRRQADAARARARQRVDAGEGADLDVRIRDAGNSAENSLVLEGLLESAVPPWGELRRFYRDTAIQAFIDRDLGAGNPADLSVAETELFHWALDPVEPADWVNSDSQVWGRMQPRGTKILERYLTLFATHRPEGLTRGRLAGASRLAFRLRCRDGLVEARLAAHARQGGSSLSRPDADLLARNAEAATDVARPDLSRERFPFTLEALTNFADMDLAVVRRAERVYAPGPGGRIDEGRGRRLNLQSGAMLDHLGFRHGGFLTSSERLADIQASLVAPGPLETAIELPARLILSPHQEAVFLTPRSVPSGIFGTADGEAGQPDMPRRLWSAELFTADADPGLRAVFSPDLAPDFVWQRLHRLSALRTVATPEPGKTAEDVLRRLPGGSAPLRGPWAPWTIGREEGGGAALSPHAVASGLVSEIPADLDDEQFCTALDDGANRQRWSLPLLIDYLCRRRSKGSTKDRQFRASLDAYARHELVLLTSAWGLPVVGRRTPSGALAERSSQVEPDPLDRLIDVEPGDAIYVPQPLRVQELALTALGGTLRHDSVFEPPAAAVHITGQSLFDALSVEKWQHWTVLGRDIFCEVVYKGFLFPLGHRASLVQVTERTFMEDMDSRRWPRPIRAYLNQRLFIRVGRPDKDYPAVGQPLGGRMFPPRRVSILTTETPDLTDPFADMSSEAAGNGPFVLPGGRIVLGDVPGLAFHPRTARSMLANVQFEMLLDGVPSSLPLLFVDNVLANDREGLERLVDYYQRLAVDAASSAMTELQLGGQKMRYADEYESGSASVETASWRLSVTGRETEPAKIKSPESTLVTDEPVKRIGSITLNNRSFQFSPILQGADQPPFYPVVTEAMVHLRQTERLMGQALPPVRARLDGAYLANGFPSRTESNASDPAAVTEGQPKTPEIYLGLENGPRQDANINGDRTGGIVRPRDVPIALSRARGVVTWSKKLDSLGAGPDVWQSVSDLLSTATKPAKEGPAATTDASQAEIAAQTLLETKLFGAVRIGKLVNVLKQAAEQAASDLMPQLTELVRYGAELAENLSPDEIMEQLRSRVILPLAELLGDTRREWERIDAQLAAAQPSVANVQPITMAEAFPDLLAGLTQLETALSEAASQTDPILFALSLSACHEAGRRFIDALRRTAANPVERFELALRERFDALSGIFEAIRDQLISELFAWALGQWADLLDEADKAKDRIAKQLAKMIAGTLVRKDARIDFRPLIPATLKAQGAEIVVPEQVAKALAMLSWSREELHELVYEAVRFNITTLLNPDTKQDLPKDRTQSFLKAWVPLHKPGKRRTWAEFYKEKLDEKLDRAGKELNGLAEDIAAQILAEIAGLRAALAAMVETQIDALVTWLADEFLHELLVAEAAAQTFVRLRDDLRRQDYVTALQRAVSFVELFTGPLGLDVKADCARFVQPLKRVIEAVDLSPLQLIPEPALTAWVDVPKGTALKDLKLAADTMPGRLYALNHAAHEGAEAINEVLVQAKAAISQTDIPADAEQAVKTVEKTLGEITAAKTDLESLRDASARLFVVLANDSLQARSLTKRLAEAAKTIDDLCKQDPVKAFKDFQGLDREILAYIRRRKSVLEAVEIELRGMAVSLQSLANNRTVQAALAGAAVVALVGDVQKNELVDKIQIAERKIVAHAVIILAKVASGFDTVATKIQEQAEVLWKEYIASVEPWVSIQGLRDNVQTLKVHVKQVKAVATALLEMASVAELALEDPNNDFKSGKTEGLTFKALADVVAQGTTDSALKFYALKPELGENSLAALLQADAAVTELLAKLTELGRTALRRAEGMALEQLDDVIRSALSNRILQVGSDRLTIPDIYTKLVEGREDIRKGIADSSQGLVNTRSLDVPARPSRTKMAEALNLTAGDLLALDAELLARVAGTPKGQILSVPLKRAFILDFFREWGTGTSAPLTLAIQIRDLLVAVGKGEILALIDIATLRDRLESQLRNLVPVAIELRYAFGLTLEDEPVANVTFGIFRPNGNPRLEIGSRVDISLLDATPVTFAAEGSIGAFDIKLVGDFLDAVTLRFGGARFTAKSGQSAEFKVDYLGHKVGRDLEFVEKLSEILNPGQGSGPYVEPRSGPGIEAGYRLAIGAFSLGAVAFDNVALNCSVVLPFGEGEARFRASLSSRDNPFTISYLPWGGFGFFAIESDSNGIVAMEASFEFGGAAIFQYGPVSGKGSLRSGLYIRSFRDQPGGHMLTDILATFYVGGSAKAWIFNFGASLMVRLGMVAGGGMFGEAIFTFSFSNGLLDFDFTVRMVKSEGKGYSSSGGNGNTQGGEVAGRSRREGKRVRRTSSPVIETEARCLGEDWGTHRSYFSPSTIEKDEF